MIADFTHYPGGESQSLAYNIILIGAANTQAMNTEDTWV